MAPRLQIVYNDPTNSGTYPTINFNPLTYRDAFNACSFQNKLNFANSGLSGAYKQLFRPVPKISSYEVPYNMPMERVESYIAFDSERGTQGHAYNPKEPVPKADWFTYLNPYNPSTRTYDIDGKFAEETLRIQNKYYPQGVSFCHPAFHPYFDQFGGSRSEQITPVVDIDPTIPPVMNMYFHVKKIGAEIKAKSGSSLVQQKLPPGIRSLQESTTPVKTIPETTLIVEI